MSWGELVRCGGSEDATVSRLGVTFGTTYDADEKVFCGRMQPTKAELAARGFSHRPEDQKILALNYISATHFSIERKLINGNSRYEITDRSRNGTIVNGRVLNTGESIELREGDKISFKFKNEIKLEYIWTTAETAFAERKDHGTASSRLTQVPADNGALASSPTSGTSLSKHAKSNGHINQAQSTSQQGQADAPSVGQEEESGPAQAAEATGRSSDNEADVGNVSAPPAPVPAPIEVVAAEVSSTSRKESEAELMQAEEPSCSSPTRERSRSCSRDDSMPKQNSEFAEPSSEVAMYIDQIEDFQQECKGLEVRNKELVREVEKLSLDVYGKDKDIEALQKKLADMNKRYEEASEELEGARAGSKEMELHEMSLKYNNLIRENESLVTKVEHRDKQLADKRLSVASTAEKRKLQASVRKEVDEEMRRKEEKLHSMESKVKQVQEVNENLAQMLKEERNLHETTVTEAMKVVEDSSAATARALSSLHSDMIAQNQLRMGGGALEAIIRNTLSTVIPTLMQALANGIEDKDKELNFTT